MASQELWSDLELRGGARILYLNAPQEQHEPVRLEDLQAVQLVTGTLDLRQLPPLP